MVLPRTLRDRSQNNRPNNDLQDNDEFMGVDLHNPIQGRGQRRGRGRPRGVGRGIAGPNRQGRGGGRPLGRARGRGRPRIINRVNPLIVPIPDALPQIQINVPDLSPPPQRGRPPIQRPAQQTPRLTTSSPTFLNVRNQIFNEDEFKFNFKRHQESMVSNVCNICNRKFFDVIVLPGSDRCEDCAKCTRADKPNRFTAENNMDPGEQPTIFKRLTLIEEMLIAQVRNIYNVYYTYVFESAVLFLISIFYTFFIFYFRFSLSFLYTKLKAISMATPDM